MTVKSGPKTNEGKLISSQNSLKHGLTTKGLTDNGEELDYKVLHHALTRDYSPEGLIETLLIDDLAMTRVKLNRFKKAEAALFIKSRNRAVAKPLYASPIIDDRVPEPDEVLINAALLDRLYRYQTTLERQFTNKLSQLIKLQEMQERKDRQKSRS